MFQCETCGNMYKKFSEHECSTIAPERERCVRVYKVAQQGNSPYAGMRVEQYERQLQDMINDGWEIGQMLPSVLAPGSHAEFINTITFSREAPK